MSENNIRRRVFTKVAKELGIKRLSWQVFRYSHATFTEIDRDATQKTVRR